MHPDTVYPESDFASVAGLSASIDDSHTRVQRKQLARDAFKTVLKTLYGQRAVVELDAYCINPKCFDEKGKEREDCRCHGRETEEGWVHDVGVQLDRWRIPKDQLRVALAAIDDGKIKFSENTSDYLRNYLQAG